MLLVAVQAHVARLATSRVAGTELRHRVEPEAVVGNELHTLVLGSVSSHGLGRTPRRG
jgi:hypothetical protein